MKLKLTLSELLQRVEKRYPSAYLTVHYGSGWSIRNLDGTVIQYGLGFDKLDKVLVNDEFGKEDSQTNSGTSAYPPWQVETPLIPNNEEQNSFDWLELYQDSYYNDEVWV